MSSLRHELTPPQHSVEAPQAPSPVQRSDRVVDLALFALTCALYYNSLQCGFVFDDVSAVKENKACASQFAAALNR